MHGTVSLAFVEVVVDFTDLAVLCYLLISLKKKPWDFSSVLIIISVNALVEVIEIVRPDGTRLFALHVDFRLGRFWSRARQQYSSYRSNFISGQNSMFSDKQHSLPST